MSDLNTSSSISGPKLLGIPDTVWPYIYTLFALIACGLVGPHDVPLITDNQHYFFISERFASGVPPHISHFDPKNALSMMMSGAAIALGRLFGIDDLYSARAMSILVAGACYGLLWMTARAYSRHRIVAHVAVLAALTLSQFFAMATIGARPKVFMVLFIIWALWAVQARRPIWAGVGAAAVFLCWQPGLIFVGLAPLAIVFWDRPLRSMAYFALGFLVLVGLYESYFIYQGALAEQLEQAYHFPSTYMSGVEPKPSAMKMRFVWMTKMKYGPTLATPLPLGGIFFLVGGAFWCVLRPLRALALLRQRPEWAYFGSTGLAALLFLHLDYQGFPDRMIVEPILVIGFSMIACSPLLRIPVGHRLRPAAWILPAFSAAFLMVSIARADLAGYRGAVLPHQRLVAAEVGKIIADGKSVWALGCTHLLAMLREDNWVRYGFFFRGTERYMIHRFGSPYIPYRDGELPDVILLSRGRIGGLQNWLPRFYERDMENAYFRNTVALWNRRETPLEEAPEGSYRTLRASVTAIERETAVQGEASGEGSELPLQSR